VVDGEASVALDLHVEVVPAFSGGDGDHNGVQPEQLMMRVCSEISRASCEHEERRLELGILAGELWTR
jgi:hypothetical protein